MGFWSGTKKVTGTIINYRVDQWVSIEYLKDVLGVMISYARNIFIPSKPEVEESFEEAKERLNITDEDLNARKKEFIRLMLIYLLFALGLFLYAMYLAIYRNDWAGTTMSFALVIYALIHSFKYHFWIYQINNRKLGCTIKDWLNSKSKQE